LPERDEGPLVRQLDRRHVGEIERGVGTKPGEVWPAREEMHAVIVYSNASHCEFRSEDV